MATINQIALTISGNTGSIEFHTRQDGGIWATFDVAQTSRTQNPQTGQWEDGATTWIRCTASGYLAEHLQHSMLPTGPDGKQKGVPVIVTGSYVQREYTNQQGAKRSILDQLCPGLLALGLTMLMVRLLNKKINPVWLIFALFGLGIIGNALGFLS